MTTTELRNVEIPRDRYGRPMVLAPGSKTRRVAYRRCTTFVKCLDDETALTLWKQRQTARGMAMRKDLTLAAAAADPDDKKTLNDIARQAMEQAQSSAAATTGTALHSLTELIDRGKDLPTVADEYMRDLDAYRETTRGLEMVDIETFRVHDEFKVAGTADRLVMWNGRLTIADIKTGSVDYPASFAMQLAMYARSLPYDIPTDTRGQDSPDLNTGLIIHLPAGKGTCDLYEIDIAKGWGACLIARKVWDWRGQKGLTHRVGEPRESTWEKSNGARPATFVDRAGQAVTLDELRDIWAQAKAAGALTPDFRAAAQERSEELATNHQHTKETK